MLVVLEYDHDFIKTFYKSTNTFSVSELTEGRLLSFSKLYYTEILLLTASLSLSLIFNLQ